MGTIYYAVLDFSSKVGMNTANGYMGGLTPPLRLLVPLCARGTVLFLGLADLSPMIFYSAFLLNNV